MNIAITKANRTTQQFFGMVLIQQAAILPNSIFCNLKRFQQDFQQLLRQQNRSCGLSYTASMGLRKAPNLRIVSLAPSATSILCAIGARESLVGVTKWCPQVAPVNGLPQLGDCWHMDGVEEILALQPTLVIGSVPYKQETVAKLLQQPVTFLAMNPRSLADIENDIRLLGRIADKLRRANNLNGSMRRRFDRLRKLAQKKYSRPRVYCEAWPNPRISSPPWVAELVEICGGEMVVLPGEKVTEQQISDAQPEVIVLAWTATGAKADPEQVYNLRVWESVPAVRERRVRVISDELLNTPGPPLIRGALLLWNAIRDEYWSEQAR